LGVAAFLTIITGMVAADEWQWGWIEGASIYLAIIIIVSISSLNDWVKDKQFVRLQNEVKNEKIAVIRGKLGATQSVNVYELVVGDIILLETGCRVPSDCILVESSDLAVDESFYEGHSTNVRKHTASEENPHNSHDPFLIS
jgi:Ca2+ transporting ATPase